MTTLAQIRDAVQGLIYAGWTASTTTQSMPLLWDDVEGDKPGHDAAGNPIAYGRSTLRHTGSSAESLGRGQGQGKEEHTAQCVVQVFGPRGAGLGVVDAMAQVVKRSMQRQPIPGVDGWFTGVTALEIASTGPWSQINVVGSLRYTETVS